MEKHWKRSFNAIWIAELLAIAGFSTTTPIIPFYFRELGIVDPTALKFWNGITQSASALALAVFAPIWGRVADSYGRKPMLLRAMIGGSVSSALLAFTNAPWQVFALRTIQGCLTGTVSAATVLTATIVPASEAGLRLGLIQTAVYLGSSIGPLAGGLVSDLFGIKTNFYATAALLAAAALIVSRFVREDFAPKPDAKAGGLKRILPDFGVLARTPALVPLLAASFAVQFAAAVVSPILPLIVLEMTGTQSGAASMSGAIQGTAALTGALAAAAFGKLAGRWGYAKNLLLCSVGAALITLPQGFVGDPVVLLVFRAAGGAFLGGMMPSINALISALCDPGSQGSTYGLSSSVSSGGAALGPLVGATVAAALGYHAVFFATGAILLVTALFVFAGIRRHGEESFALGGTRHGGTGEGT